MNNYSAKLNVPPSQKLNLLTKIAYGAGDLGPAMGAVLSAFFLLLFFTNVAGLPAGLAGSILMIGKIWDAINDPIVGIMSDRTVHPWGRRYPWMIYGAIPFGIFLFLQWIVPSQNTTILFCYYVAISIIANTFYTVVNLPYTALTPELTQDYNERTSLNSFRFAFSIGGSIFALVLANIIFNIFATEPEKKYIILAAICSVIAILAIYFSVWGTWRQVMTNIQYIEAGDEGNENLSFPEQLKIAFSNKPFLYVIGIYLCSWLAVQLTTTIIPYFVMYWMNIPETQVPIIAIVVQTTALAMLFVWSAISKKIGKKAVYFWGSGFYIMAQVGLFFLQPGQNSFMYFLAVLAGIGISTAYLVPWSMIPDVIDLDELNTHRRREGIFYSFMVLLQKIGLALGLFLVGQMLQLSGFITQRIGDPIPVQPESALFAIRIAIAPLPTFFLICGVFLAYLYPITQTVHEEILLKLHERKLH
ncbi:MAG: MFS transporter [Microcoleaceae cyanobacterium]